MKDKKYNEYVEHCRESFNNYKGLKRKIEHYSIYFHRSEDGIWFRFPTNWISYHADDGMTLKDVERELVRDFPFIESVQFYDEIGYGAGIII